MAKRKRTEQVVIVKSPEPPLRLKRWEKNLIHCGLLLLIVCSLWTEGGKLADWAFLALSVACELC